jgi:hypothetical protein
MTRRRLTPLPPRKGKDKTMSTENLNWFGWIWFALTVGYLMSFLQGLAAIASPALKDKPSKIDEATSNPAGVAIAIAILCYMMT